MNGFGMARTSRPGRGGDELVRELLSSSLRQAVVRLLVDRGGNATFDEIVEALVDGSDEPLMAIRLHHIHLPKLEATGAVEWNSDTGAVRLTPRAHQTLDTVGDSDLFGRVGGD